MNCRECGDRVKITNTYTGAYAKTSKAICYKCRKVTTLVTLTLSDSDRGAKAWLSRVDKENLEDALGVLHNSESD